MQKKIFPVILTAALVLSSIFSVLCLHNLQGNAKVINYAGIVRGATQRLVKEELNGIPNDLLIAKLDGILDELQSGNGRHGLIRMNSREFQDLILQMEADWSILKEEIYLVRAGGDAELLFEDSESYFDLADRAVLAAEQFSERRELLAEKSLLLLNCFFVLMIFFFYLYSSGQARRQKELQEIEAEDRKRKEHLSHMVDNLLGPMNEISELVYVSDLEDHTLLFVNKAGQETFHIDTMDGQKCYKVLQGFDSPCDFCTSPILKEGEIYTWEYTNPLTQRHYILKDRLIQWKGRAARMELAFDTTESEKEKIQLKLTLETNEMITECVQTLYQSEDVDTAIAQVLEHLGSFLSADRAYILYIRDGKMYNDYEWCSDGVESQQAMLQDLPLNLITRWLTYFDKKECVLIEDMEQIRESVPEEYQILHAQSITSLVAAPLEQDGTLIGYLGVDNPPPDRIRNIAPLLQTLCYFLMLARSHSESKQLLTHLSYYDKLTDFYNRNKYIVDTGALAHSKQSVGIVYLDVNGLKDINDHYGHEFGDRVLIECAKRIKATFTQADFYRIGGDEFVIISPGITQEVFLNQVRELKAKFRNDSDCQAAIGSQWMESIENISRIIAAADAKMYENKKAFYRINPVSRRYRRCNDRLLQHLSDSETLKREFAENHFLVYFQPKISSENRLIVGCEALIRYTPQPGVLITPSEFLPLLEEFDTVSLIDFYVFRFVCSRLKAWQDQGRQIFPVSVNFSLRTLREAALSERLLAICNQFGIPAGYLEIEITEKVHNEENLNIKQLITELQNAGFTVTLDDFGTECANVVLMSEVSFDALNLDKSMVDHITTNSRNRAIVESISEVCLKLGIRMVAEGIESEEQFAVLRACGIDLFQGYLFSKPVPVEEFEQEYLGKQDTE
ncbi:EAL domain-containing protein [Hungatella sp.]|uniref:sensor domain-containing phosphodiesterase n=1 Tax=Hungatella sp. TaxID=2613924 RepID=UPI002A80939D|nr:EAL domain-containing protein [Hungatella sp.]